MQGNTQGTLPDIVKTIVFNAPIQKVWEAVATSEGIAAWLMPNDFQPQVGYEFHLQSPFGPTPCKVLELDSPNRLSFVWGKFGWHVSFELKELDGKTEFTVTHSGWGKPDEIIPESGEKQSVIHDTMNNGWEPLVNNNLRRMVES
jgi:uncharacterized protein YndB with AHSA1/START domain